MNKIKCFAEYMEWLIAGLIDWYRDDAPQWVHFIAECIGACAVITIVATIFLIALNEGVGQPLPEDRYTVQQVSIGEGDCFLGIMEDTWQANSDKWEELGVNHRTYCRTFCDVNEVGFGDRKNIRLYPGGAPTWVKRSATIQYKEKLVYPIPLCTD